MGPFLIELFASWINTHHPNYCSWTPDPAALAVDALLIIWWSHFLYMFPPFTLIPHCLEKISQEGVTANLIALVWPNQVWFPQLLQSLIDYPVMLPPTQDILMDSHTGHSDGFRGPQPPPGGAGPPASSHMACLRYSWHSEGLSDTVVVVLKRSWQYSTESAYSSAWNLRDS